MGFEDFIFSGHDMHALAYLLTGSNQELQTVCRTMNYSHLLTNRSSEHEPVNTF